MYHVECIDIHKNDPLFPYLDRASLCANNMYNVSNFYIRNLMTGLKKDPSLRTENERAVIDTVSGSICGINERLREKYELKIRNIRRSASLSLREQEKKAAAVNTSSSARRMRGSGLRPTACWMPYSNIRITRTTARSISMSSRMP